MEEVTDKKPTDKKSKKKNSKDFEVNPDLDSAFTSLRAEEKLVETLTRMGRIKIARAMKRSSRAGKLARGKRKMAARAMTMKRASGLGWRAARRSVKSTLAGGRNVSKLSAAEKSRVEKLTDKRRERVKIAAKIKTRERLRREDTNIDLAFNLMLEGKRYHQLMNNNNTVKIDKRFKQYRKKDEAAKITEDQIICLTRLALDEGIPAEALILKWVSEQQEGTLSEHATFVSNKLNIDYDDLMEKYNAYDY